MFYTFYITDTFTTANVTISTGHTLEEVCVGCELVFNDSSIGCYVEVKKYDNDFLTPLELMALNGSNLAAGCTEKLPCGHGV